MPEEFERLIKLAYRKWKAEQPASEGAHPDEETFICFLEGRLSQQEVARIEEHLIVCVSCAEVFALSAKLKISEEKEVPEGLIRKAKDLLKLEEAASLLEIILKLKEKALELLATSGDVLVGQELVPAPLLRSRQIKDFKDEVTILKDFGDFIVQAKIENKGGAAFDLSVLVKEKKKQEVIKDLRVSLIKDEVELESCLTTSGRVVFEHVLLGKYTVEILSIEKKIASILLEIKA